MKQAVFQKMQLGSFIIGQIGKTAFTAEFLAVANTLDGGSAHSYMCVCMVYSFMDEKK